MYFRFPLLVLFVIAGSIGLFYISSKFKNPDHFEKNESLASDTLNTQTFYVKSDTLEKPSEVDSSDTAVKSIREHELRAHLNILADDLFEGREVGTIGARLASRYIASQFEQVGLRPVGANQTFFQLVPLYKKMVMPNSELKFEVDGELIPLIYKKDFIVLSIPEEDTFELTAGLVFSGFGIQAPEYNYDDFKDVNVEGKVTVYLSGEPSSADVNYFWGDNLTKYAAGFNKRKTAQDLKAAGAIRIYSSQDLEQWNWNTIQDVFTRGKTSLNNKKPGNDDPVFPAILIHPDAGALLFSGTQKSFEEINNAAAEGNVSSFEMVKNIQMKINVDGQIIEDRNVVGYLEGSDPVLKSEVIIYTAHYDHVGIGATVQGDSIYNGAADNASGVAGLLELAEAFTLLPMTPKRSILFLAVTAEEKGLLGSEYYVNNPIFPLSKTVANFNLDMIGIGDTTGIVVYGIERSSLGEVITKAAREIQLAILPDELPEENIFQRSDHYAFARKGIPAIFPGSGINRTFLPEFKSFYHQPTDDVNLPFNYAYMKKHVQILFLAGLWVANAEDAPEWTAGDEFEKFHY